MEGLAKMKGGGISPIMGSYQIVLICREISFNEKCFGNSKLRKSARNFAKLFSQKVYSLLCRTLFVSITKKKRIFVLH